MWCKCKYTQIVNYNQRRLLNKTKTFLVSAIIARGQETERRAVTSLTHSGCFQPSTNPVPSDKAPRNHRALSLSFPLISLWKPLLQTENESLSLFSHPWRCRCSTPLPVNSPTSRHSTVQTAGGVRLNNCSIPFPFCLDLLRDTHPFLLSPCAPIHLLGQDFLKKFHAASSFFQNGEIIPESDYSSSSNNQNSHLGKLNDHKTSFICSLSKTNSNTSHSSLLDQLPPSLWAKSAQTLADSTVHLIQTYKESLESLSPELTSTLQIKRPSSTEEPGGLKPTGCKRVGQDSSN